MRVSFSCALKPESGKQNFAIRLCNAFENIGIKVTEKNPDINIVFIKGIRKHCKNVIRLDGIWMNNKISFEDKNKKIWSTIKKVDGVIYQNSFCKKAVNLFCGKPSCMTSVIHNGADPKRYTNSYVHNRPYLLAFCRWRPHKRLKDTIEGFLSSGIHDQYDLIVCGKADYIIKHPNVFYFGTQGINKIDKLVSGCSCTIHLAYLDWCPNSVVESLVAGKPVLHTSSGGTALLVKENGICIKDADWDFKPCHLYSPPNLDKQELIEGYKKIVNIKFGFVREDLFIDKIAKEYKLFLEKVLYG